MSLWEQLVRRLLNLLFLYHGILSVFSPHFPCSHIPLPRVHCFFIALENMPANANLDYAAPEVLAGKPYGGKEQDVWALGILLYTIIYKENPFYSIDEIMDRDLRVPYTISDESIDLIRRMLNRDVAARYTIEEVVEHPWCQMD